MKELIIQLKGKSPLLMHRYGGEKPAAVKVKTASKTEAWLEEMHKKDWLQSAYFDEKIGFYIPPQNCEAMLIEGARASRQGKTFESSMSVVEFMIPLIVYAGPELTTIKHLNDNLESHYIPEHIDLRGVKLTGRVDRCRPIFRFWGLLFTVRYDNKRLTVKDFEAALDEGALGDYRPRFGRFTYAVKQA